MLKEASVTSLAYTHAHVRMHTCTYIHTHTHTECRNKAEAAMVHHASFTLHLLWSTEKKQTKVCHSIWASLYLFSLFLHLSHSASALHFLNSSSLPLQYNKKKAAKTYSNVSTLNIGFCSTVDHVTLKLNVCSLASLCVQSHLGETLTG